MDTLIEKFSFQLKEALEIGETVEIRKGDHKISKVLVIGMGGSGIGGNIVAEIVKEECKVPYLVSKSYSIPAYADKNTLAIVSSYSGNTEETLSAFEQLLSTGAKIVCIASGGKLIDKAKELGLDHFLLPDNWPSPRACVGYSIVQQLFVLYKLGLINRTKIDNVKSSIDLIKYDQDDIKKKAREVAAKIYGKTPIIYSTDKIESISVRLRQQINENAKQLCWHHVIPEMNHNELVGWKDRHEDFAVICLRNKDDYRRNALRIDISIKIISQFTSTIIELYSKGQSSVEKAIYFIHLGDWISWYLSELNEVDAIEIDVIDFLKSELGRV